IISETSENGIVAVNALATAHASWNSMAEKLAKANRQLKDMPLLDQVWTNRPAPSKKEVYVHPIERAGKPVTEKIEAIRAKMTSEGATAHVISSLDDVAWTLNLRGSDVSCNPVFLSYILISTEHSIL